MSTAYPDEPWRLAGEAFLSVWAVPRATLPGVSATVTPLRAGGRSVVVTAWIDYTPPGQLAYHELLAAVAVARPRRSGPRPAGSVTEIWVDDAASLAGGRELWGIPKEIATLEFDRTDGFTGSAATRDEWIATAAFASRGPRVPAVSCAFSIVQSVAGQPLRSPVRARTRAQLASASWTVNPDGPLGYLAGRRPLVSARVSEARLLFGTDRR